MSSATTPLQRLAAALDCIREQAARTRGTPRFGALANELRQAALALRHWLAGEGVPFAEVDSLASEAEAVGNQVLHGVEASELRPLIDRQWAALERLRDLAAHAGPVRPASPEGGAPNGRADSGADNGKKILPDNKHVLGLARRLNQRKKGESLIGVARAYVADEMDRKDLGDRIAQSLLRQLRRYKNLGG